MAPTNKSKKSKNNTRKFTINCQAPVDDGILDIASFNQYLTEHIKVEGKVGNLGEKVKVDSGLISRVSSRTYRNTQTCTMAPTNKSKKSKNNTRKFTINCQAPVDDGILDIASFNQYLTERYLKKNNLREWLRVVAENKESYTLKYFNIN